MFLREKHPVMASPLPSPQFGFFSPHTTCRRRRLSLCTTSHSILFLSRNDRRFYSLALRTGVKALKEDDGAVVVVEDREPEFAEKVHSIEFSGNGAASSIRDSDYSYNGSALGREVVRSENGVSNGSLVKYVNGNGVPAQVVVGEVEVPEAMEERRKKKLEEIGKEDAWFKQSSQEKVQV